MRIVIVSESFLPTVNGVTNSVLKVLDYLSAEGHDAIVICPSAGAPRSYAGFVVHAVPALAYRQFPVGLPNPQVHKLIADFRPDVVHAAAPFLLGAQAISSANRLGIPTVAIFQTDVAGYARRHRLGQATKLAWRIVRWIHDGAQLTLAPSSTAMADLKAIGLTKLERWGRGVDLAMYHPAKKLSPATARLRTRLAPRGEVVIGYVGRIAPEKQVERLRTLRGLTGVRVAIVGDGSSTALVKKELAGIPVTWLGKLGGEELATAYAAFDIFAHTGTEETFGQTLQEAHAAGLPVVAPRAGGPIDLIDHGNNGFLFEADNDGELRAYVEALAVDSGLRARMGEAGRRTVLNKSWSGICAELMGHYESAIAALPVFAPKS
ncbi:glycosyltransferase family 1 protein [Salinibacterium sp. UTAS2018]|uniref:glycosyltransferase family 4 protein n=1 Tax=Salinibacterium sp. UTAS2018 TaxID=2508880 RepID=UPI0010094FC0|nr:glycosyltransferase family 1 protein [Salinibacterium sp. UTAS2018]QAV71677.1 glycosyltransferase family 1 protein [Salinibacterium sp. UTAS2018]